MTSRSRTLKAGVRLDGPMSHHAARLPPGSPHRALGPELAAGPPLRRTEPGPEGLTYDQGPGGVGESALSWQDPHVLLRRAAQNKARARTWGSPAWGHSVV